MTVRHELREMTHDLEIENESGGEWDTPLTVSCTVNTLHFPRSSLRESRDMFVIGTGMDIGAEREDTFSVMLVKILIFNLKTVRND